MSPRAVSIGVTAALHAAAFGALLQLDAVRKPLAETLPLMVSLITPPRPDPPPPPPKIEPPRPRPVMQRPIPVPPVQKAEPPPLLAVDSTASGPVQVAALPKPAPVSVVAAVSPVTAPVPAPVQPASFDAAYLRNPPPAYPAASRRRGEQGRVVLRVLVSADGAAERVEVRSSSGHERLDRAASEAVHQWRFVPARQGEKPVAAWVLVPILFSLES
jgi:protein TonB